MPTRSSTCGGSKASRASSRSARCESRRPAARCSRAVDLFGGAPAPCRLGGIEIERRKFLRFRQTEQPRHVAAFVVALAQRYAVAAIAGEAKAARFARTGERVIFAAAFHRLAHLSAVPQRCVERHYERRGVLATFLQLPARLERQPRDPPPRLPGGVRRRLEAQARLPRETLAQRLGCGAHPAR